ncbi:cysteine--tRNA ligase [Rubricoccus marinus]|uniref:Cysteine--tRNA ligase n=1 Tax=Rubricoccus marinus TaxID=716817 RepID=A0A259TYF4_9BACT|nr:cysteine--tRNA ligase [Rubricoccus marinus]OZC02647.1 cysteine--tRNA ligase [Rubricoccus marinus]
MPETPEFRLHNTLTRQTEALMPTETAASGAPLLRFYSCGPTVYSFAHVGNFRTFLTADLVVRTAKALGWEVRYVSNVTDVGHLTDDDVADAGGEDKLAKALASKEGERFANVWDLARHYTGGLVADWNRLNLVEPDVRPRATEHVTEQIDAVCALMEGGHAYETEDGVYFHVPSFEGYGKLSGNEAADALRDGLRELVQDSGKRDPRDFALWKKDPGHLMQWHAPFGKGFPGWHLECSVMAQKYLGTTIDLHGGGEDLRFPHHECEIAQAEALTGEPFSRMWIHTRFLQVEGEKMSKSKGNFLTVRDLTVAPEFGGREDWGAPVDPLALRLLLISGQYGKPFNLTRKALEDAAKNRQRYVDALDAAQNASGADVDRDLAAGLGEELDEAYADALDGMTDDLNTPVALAAALRGANAILALARGPGLDAGMAGSAMGYLQSIDSLLGIVGIDAPDVPADGASGGAGSSAADAALGAEVDALLREREAARANKDWARADALRDEIDALGVIVMDTPSGPTWKRA